MSQRQPNGRPCRVQVALTGEQRKSWQAQADADGVTLPRWIVDRIEGKPPTMIRRALYAEVAAIRAEVAGAMANVNQLARSAHMAGFDPAGWLVTVAAVARQGVILDGLAARLT